jgi:predicted GTPase
MRSEQPLLTLPASSPPPEFSPREEAAWQIVHEYQERIDRNELTLSSVNQLLELGEEILSRIAAFARPEEKSPLFAVPVPLLLRAIEETARDLATITTQLPFAHRITISEMVRGYRFGQKMKPVYELYQLYRFLSPLINPQSGIFRILITDKLFDLTKETLNQWLLKWYVDRIGYHAIELYSGRLLLTRRSDDLSRLQPETAAVMTRAESRASEPLRILVLGQVKAGKSSLVNALFGEMRAMTDSVPTTMQLTPYVLDRPELGGKVLLCDMGGYEDPSAPRERREQAFMEAARADLVILVVSAVNVARAPDRQLLADLRAHFTVQLELRPPPVTVALTHIDLLRPPLEWAPPYNVEQPDSPKAHSIRGALEAVAGDLGVEAEAIAPLCLLPERIYNVNEALLPLLVQQLPEGKRVLLLRSLKTVRAREQWELVWLQARAAGRFLWKIGGEVVKKSVERVLSERRME